MKIDNRKLDLLLARQCMSRRDLRDRNGASPQTLQRIGKGEDVKPKTAGRIARALGVDVTEIIEQEAK